MKHYLTLKGYKSVLIPSFNVIFVSNEINVYNSNLYLIKAFAKFV